MKTFFTVTTTFRIKSEPFIEIAPTGIPSFQICTDLAALTRGEDEKRLVLTAGFTYYFANSCSACITITFTQQRSFHAIFHQGTDQYRSHYFLYSNRSEVSLSERPRCNNAADQSYRSCMALYGQPGQLHINVDLRKGSPVGHYSQYPVFYFRLHLLHKTAPPCGRSVGELRCLAGWGIGPSMAVGVTSRYRHSAP
jgi:hypothetical protein